MPDLLVAWIDEHGLHAHQFLTRDAAASHVEAVGIDNVVHLNGVSRLDKIPEQYKDQFISIVGQ